MPDRVRSILRTVLHAAALLAGWGDEQHAANRYRGTATSARVWSRALTSSEIDADYHRHRTAG